MPNCGSIYSSPLSNGAQRSANPIISRALALSRNDCSSNSSAVVKVIPSVASRGDSGTRVRMRCSSLTGVGRRDCLVTALERSRATQVELPRPERVSSPKCSEIFMHAQVVVLRCCRIQIPMKRSQAARGPTSEPWAAFGSVPLMKRRSGHYTDQILLPSAESALATELWEAIWASEIRPHSPQPSESGFRDKTPHTHSSSACSNPASSRCRTEPR